MMIITRRLAGGLQSDKYKNMSGQQDMSNYNECIIAKDNVTY